ncbi:hypothetical protein THIOM_001647 [Candidatus Thiomargarita nelsonii]|uniref:Uncharacterized protein n=1 Tax=Candidatus Thiomargarita nelsonii TaxID=1003181 RepID=A0A176S362_9GAMM|nr:hypothetical protein THIOM_001647 [Candidatus Thiomargarita nelsonii]
MMVSIIFNFVLITSTAGTIRCSPGSRVLVYLPKRSTVHCSPWETDLTPKKTNITAIARKIKTNIAKSFNMSIGIFYSRCQ